MIVTLQAVTAEGLSECRPQVRSYAADASDEYCGMENFAVIA